MVQGEPPSRITWATLKCPDCKVRMRIKAAYLHLRGRCPECGRRIPVLRPRPVPPRLESTANEPQGLVPEEEEWPERATIVDDKLPYVVGAQPAVFPELPPVEPPPLEAGYGLAASEPPTAAPPPIVLLYTEEAEEPTLAGTIADSPCPVPLIGQESLAGLVREPPPTPPDWPLWKGVYTFPWRSSNLAVWLYLGLDVLLIAACVAAFIAALQSGERFVIAFVGVLSIAGGVMVLIVAGSYAANCFLAIVEATAAGNESCDWPEGFNVIEGLGTFFHLAWLCCFATLPVYLLVTTNAFPEAGDYGWLPIVLVWLITFPIMLLSSLASESRWVLLNRQIVKGVFLHPFAWLTLCASSLGMAFLCGELAQIAICQVNFVLLPVLGFFGSACLLIYARLLGRVGWILTQTKHARIRVKRRRLKWDVGWPPETPDANTPSRGEM